MLKTWNVFHSFEFFASLIAIKFARDAMAIPFPPTLTPYAIAFHSLLNFVIKILVGTLLKNCERMDDVRKTPLLDLITPFIKAEIEGNSDTR